jgi:hypothetical protein
MRDRWNTVRRIVAVAALSVAASAGIVVAAPGAGAVVLPTDADGCPAGGDPNSALPCATFELGCPKFGLGVRLANGAGAALDAVFRITTPTTTNTFTLAPNESVFPNVHIGEDQTVHIVIEELVTGLVFVDDTFTRDCTEPGGSVAEPTCADGGALVTLTNDTDVDGATVDFVIDVYDHGSPDPTRTFTVNGVGPDGDDLLVPADGDGAIRIVVTGLTREGPPGTEPTAEQVADETFTVDCEHPAPSAVVDHDCATGITIDVVTPDAEAGETTFHVVLTDEHGTVVLDRTVTIDGAGTERVTFDNPGEDVTYHVVVTTGATTLAAGDLLVDCSEVLPTSVVNTTRPPTQVQGVQVGRELPRTGAPSAVPQILVAIGLLLGGVGFVGLGSVPGMTPRRRTGPARVKG